MKIAVTGAAGRIGYNFLFRILEGELLPQCSKEKLVISCIEAPIAMNEMNAIISEIRDCNFPCLKSITSTSEPSEGFRGASLIVLISSAFKQPGTPRSSLLSKNVEIFHKIGQSLNEEYKAQLNNLKKDPFFRVLVVANPANTVAWIASHFAPDVPKSAFCSLSQLDLQRAYLQFSQKLKLPLHRVTNLLILGNHSSSQVPVCSLAKIDGRASKVGRIFQDNSFQHWAQNQFRQTVRFRNDNIEKYSGYSSTCSAASAVINQLKNMLPKELCEVSLSEAKGEPGFRDHWTVMGVYAKDVPGVEEDLFISLPVLVHEEDGSFVVEREGMKVDSETREEFEKSIKELQTERDEAIEAIVKLGLEKERARG